MSFVSPYIFWALLLLSIPVIIHLFSFRRAITVYFSNTRLLEAVKEETSSKLRNETKDIVSLRALIALRKLSITISAERGDLEAHHVSMTASSTLSSNGSSSNNFSIGWFWILDDLESNLPC